jgi:hypothetical protein
MLFESNCLYFVEGNLFAAFLYPHKNILYKLWLLKTGSPPDADLLRVFGWCIMSVWAVVSVCTMRDIWFVVAVEPMLCLKLETSRGWVAHIIQQEQDAYTPKESFLASGSDTRRRHTI